MPRTREELVRTLARRWKIQHKPAAQRIDAVLDLVLELCRESGLEHEWLGGPLFEQLLKWRGER